MKLVQHIYLRLTLVAILLVALGTSGFAHRFVPADDALTAYVAAGGSYADICADAGIDGATQSCDACRLVDTAAVPIADRSCTAVVDRVQRLVFTASRALDPASGFDPTRPVRAPPVA